MPRDPSREAAGKKWARALLAALTLLLVVPLSGQEERLVHFSLRSGQTYQSGDHPKIDLWAHNVEELEFRVYRVNDPIAFFAKLDDLHQFGGRAPELPKVQGFLERLHRFKRDWRGEIRWFFRRQFSREARERIRAWLVGPQPAVTAREAKPPVAKYAQVPVLNPQQLVATWQQPVRKERYYWESQSVGVPVTGKGVYLVEAAHENKRAFTIVIVTDLVVLTKSWPGHLLNYVVNRRSGEPVANCPVWLRENKNQVKEFTADGTGLIEMSLAGAASGQALVMARCGDDFAAASTNYWGVGYGTGVTWTGYIYTDRPVYRPTHTVYFRGLLRQQAPLGYQLPDRRQVFVEIQDPDGKAVFRKTLPVSAMGTVHGEYALPENAALGHYSVIVHATGQPPGETPSGGGEAEGEAAGQGYGDMSGDFQVEEYKKPEYEVKVTPSAPRILEGANIQATIEARYYFGEPVANAKVTYVLHRQRYWLPYYLDEEEQNVGEDEEGGGYDAYGEQTEEQEGRLDSQGKLVVNLPTSVSEHKFDYRYRIEARVTDAANREISGHAYVLATYGSFFVHVTPDKYVYSPGDTAHLDIDARDYDGKPIETPVRLELLRWGGGERQVLSTFDARTDASGKARVDVRIPEAGYLQTRVTARTPEGREIEALGYIWVSGTGASWYWGENRQRVQIIPDKKSYAPGEVAKVLLLSSVPEVHILVTTERRQVMTRQVIVPTGTSTTVEIPITREYEPNFFVSAAFVRDNQVFQGSKSISVPPVEHTLSVELAASKKEYRPGEQGLYTVTARDFRGQPVAAEFSLGVVDEAIYAIRPESARDILQFFYGNTPNSVSLSDSLSYWFSGEAGVKAIELAMGGGGAATARAQIKPETLAQPQVRKEFRDTALWVADLTTDASGHAQARLTFPDTLTTWRATARGVTRDTKVGSALLRNVVRKNLILRLAVPRFFTQGDEVTVSAIVQNYLASEKRARVSLEVTGLEILEGATREVSVPSKGEAKLDWRVRAAPGREAKLLGKALTDEESDALELTLPVVPYGVKMSEGRAGSLSKPSSEAEAQLDFPPSAVPDSRQLEISVSPSVAGALFGALEYLTSYPYGCTEQTMSSFLPNVVVAKAMRDLKVKSNVDEAALAKKIKAGLERLYDFQHDDGGWGWWKTDESAAFMTAYVLYGFGQAQTAGVQIDPDRVRRAREWLRGEFIRQSRALPDLRAYMVYAMATAGDPKADSDLLEEVWRQRNDLTPYGVALLGLVLERLSDARAQEMAAKLESTVRADEAQAYWSSDRDTLMDFYEDTSAEATAFAMKLLTRVRPDSPLLPKVVVWLLDHRTEGFYWDSTKKTAMVIFGLTEYLKASGELRPNFSVEVAVNGRSVLSRRFTEADAMAPTAPVIRLGPQDLAVGRNTVHFRKNGEGRLYWTVLERYFSTDEKLARSGTVSLNLLREYFRLVPERQGEAIVYSIEPLAGTLQPGDVIAVRLTVSGTTWRYVMVEDPIPAGTEFIERDDLYNIKSKPSWWEYFFTRREFHDNRAVLFETYFDRGQRQYFYLLKVVNPGRFRVSPARVEPMYQPRFFATSDSRIVEVK